MSDKNEQLHNQGEKDASDGEYNPPHSVTEEVASALPFVGTQANHDRIVEENESYNKGWRNTHGQK